MVTLKAGEYYIGDCCYVLSESYLDNFDWIGDFCNKIGDEGVEVLGYKLAVFGTMHGDGVYDSNIDFDFPVDAGIIGCTPKELWQGGGEPFGCKLIKFDNDFKCYKDGGTLVFGHVEVETDYDEQEE